MITVNYLAYGSNLFPPRLAARIPIVATAGVVALAGWRLEFTKRGKDGSGKCNLRRDPGDCAYGVVYRIAVADQAILDCIEGRGRGYDLGWLELPAHGPCFFYCAPTAACDERLRPYDWYHAYVLAGARAHGLPPAYVGQIAAVEWQLDPDNDRRAENLARLARLA